MGWYVLFVSSGKEILTQKWMELVLEEGFFDSCVPRKLISEKRKGIEEIVEKVIFPGYVFVDIDMTDKNYYKLKNISSCYKILKNGDCCASVPKEQMSLIFNLIKDDGIINYSKAYMENSRAIIVEGPLKGMDGAIKKINKRKKRATIEFKFLDEVKLINLGIEFIEKDEVNRLKIY